MNTKTAQGRVTYESREDSYNLDSSRVFEVVSDLNTYLHFAEMEAKKANHPKTLTPSSNLRGKGRELALSTEVVNTPGFLTSFDLANLVLSEDAKSLKLKVHAHPRVAINPIELYAIADRYKVK